MTTFSIQAELASMRAQCAAVDTLLGLDPRALTHAATSVSAWPPLHHLAHVTLANELVLRNLRSLVKGSGMFVVEKAEPRAEVLALLGEGVLLRGQAQSPRMVVPPSDVDIATVKQWSTELQNALADLARDPTAFEQARGYVPHQLLGPLEHAQWARFGAVHTRHHVLIAVEALAANGVTGIDVPELARLLDTPAPSPTIADPHGA